MRFEDRLSWRTAVLNALFLLLLLLLLPQTSFLALSIRGDWMLDGRTGHGVEIARSLLIKAASATEWTYTAFNENPYEQTKEEFPTRCDEHGLRTFFGADPDGSSAEAPHGSRKTLFSTYDMFSGGCGRGSPDPGYSAFLDFPEGVYPTRDEQAEADLRFSSLAPWPPEPPLPSDAELAVERHRRVVATWDPALVQAEAFRARHPDYLGAYENTAKTHEGYAKALQDAGSSPELVRAQHKAASTQLDAGCHLFVEEIKEKEWKASLCEDFARLLRESGDNAGALQASKDAAAALAGGPAALRREAGRSTSAKAPSWPLHPLPDPIVVTMPADVETSIQAVGEYIANRTLSDPYRRAKALHDYVALRIAYDYEALLLYPRIPRSAVDAETVWTNRKGVCAGYSNLFVALAKAAGVDAVYLHGDIRNGEAGIGPHKHAWNAVEAGGSWYLLDTTWDAGTVKDGRYRTLYLFSPASTFGLDHLPEDSGWQLRPSPITRTDFVRQPLIGPALAAKGLSLVLPTRPQVDAGKELRIFLDNPRGVFLQAEARQGELRGTCKVLDPAHTKVLCTFPHRGAWRVLLFGSDEETGDGSYFGAIDVNANP